MSQNVESTTELTNSTQEQSLKSVAKVKKRTRKIPKCVRSEEFIELVKVIPKKDYKSRIAFLLAYGAGLRVSEVLRCTEEHFKPNSLFIPQSKYGVERFTPIPKGWKQEFFKSLPLNTTARSLERRFKKYSKLANLPSYYTFHSLRHGFATRCLEMGMPLNQVQVLMGHSSIATTGIYTLANPKDAIKSYEDYF